MKRSKSFLFKKYKSNSFDGRRQLTESKEDKPLLRTKSVPEKDSRVAIPNPKTSTTSRLPNAPSKAMTLTHDGTPSSKNDSFTRRFKSALSSSKKSRSNESLIDSDSEIRQRSSSAVTAKRPHSIIYSTVTCITQELDNEEDIYSDSIRISPISPDNLQTPKPQEPERCGYFAVSPTAGVDTKIAKKDDEYDYDEIDGDDDNEYEQVDAESESESICEEEASKIIESLRPIKRTSGVRVKGILGIWSCSSYLSFVGSAFVFALYTFALFETLENLMEILSKC